MNIYYVLKNWYGNMQKERGALYTNVYNAVSN